MNGMQGLLNVLGGGSAMGMQGLLTPEQQRAIQQQSMMAMAAKLLQAGGPSTTRTSLGQALGGAFEAGQGAMQSGQMNAIQQMLLGQKLQDAKSAQEQRERFNRMLSGEPAAPMTQDQALAAPVAQAGPVGPTQQRASMVGATPQPASAQSPQAQQAVLSMLSPEQRALIANLGPVEGGKRLLDITQEAMKFGAPEFYLRDGKLVAIQRNSLGEERERPGLAPRDTPPSTIQEYEYAARQGYQGSLQQYIMDRQRAGAASQVVQVGSGRIGTIPPGYEAIEDPTTGAIRFQEIPGGPAEKERMREQQAEQFKQQNLERAGGTVVQDIGRVLNILQEAGPLATGRGAIIGRLDPVSQASQIEDLVASVRGNIGVDQLQQMRNASPTGGALGNVTERQLEGLQGLLGSLKVTGDRKILEDNLKRISNIYMDTIHGTPEQIRLLGPQRGLTPEQIQMLSERHTLSFDERGRRIDGAGRPTQQRSLNQIFGR